MDPTHTRLRRMRRLLPVVAIVLPGILIALTLLQPGENLGYDYEAYVRAAQRFLDGQPLYDPQVEQAGGFAVYLYPPPFALAMVPFALLPDALGTWLWMALLVGCFVAGVAALPVPATVRWLVLLLGGINWPVLYGLRLGQVGPILFLLFCLCWRWLDRQERFGIAAALGAIVKVQPGLLLAWALLTRRWRAVVAGSVVLLVVGAVTTLVVGTGAWSDYVSLLRAIGGNPVTTEHNFAPGAVAFQLGAPESVAVLIQAVTVIATVLVVLAAIRWSTAEQSLICAIVASQLVSPLLWDHYAIVLLIPAAYLLARGHAWGVAIPLVTVFPVALFLPPLVYPVVFAVGLVAPLVVGRRGTNDGPTGPEWVR